MKKAYAVLWLLFLPFLVFSCSPPDTPGADDPPPAATEPRGEAEPAAPADPREGQAETANDAGDAFAHAEAIELEAPVFEGTMSVEEALATRVSRRHFSADPPSSRELSQVLWAAYGTGVDGETGATRTVPSAGGVYFLEIFIITTNLGEGTDLPAGIYRYDWQNHRLLPKVPGDQRSAMAQTSSYGFIEQAPVSIILAVDFQRAARFQMGERYASMEIGYATQNIHLQTEALGMGSVAVAGFDAPRLKALLETEFEPMIIIPVGKR